jgi:hypothetical protein
MSRHWRHMLICASSHSVAQSTDALFAVGYRSAVGVAVWVLAIRRFKRRYLGLDGNTKPKSKLGRCGKDFSTGCNLVRFAGPKKREVEKVNGAD